MARSGWVLLFIGGLELENGAGEVARLIPGYGQFRLGERAKSRMK
jgi:hypothetical protein